MKRILVTGANGFLGSHLVDALAKIGHKVVALDVKERFSELVEPKLRIACLNIAEQHVVDISDEHALDRWQDGDFDIVFHCAGILGTSLTFNYVIRTELVNVIGTLRVMEKFKTQTPIVMPGLIDYWGNPYMWSKHRAEDYGILYSETFGTKITTIRITHAYGGRQSTKQGKAVPDFIMAARAGLPLTVYGDGSTAMNLLYIKDVVDFLIAVMDKEFIGNVTLLHPSADPTVLELAGRIIEMTNSTSLIRHEPMRRGQPVTVDYSYHDIVNETDADEIYDRSKFTDMEFGLIETINWYETNIPVVVEDR